MPCPPITDDVLQARRGKEILLAESQLLAVLGRGVRVQHHRDVLGKVLRRDGIEVTACVEFFEIEFVGCGSRPEAQRVDDTIAVTRNRDIERNREDIVSVDPFVAGPAVFILACLDSAAELDGLRELEAFHFPREPFAQPRIRFFHLVAVFEPLAEHAVLVANAIADDR